MDFGGSSVDGGGGGALGRVQVVQGGSSAAVDAGSALGGRCVGGVTDLSCCTSIIPYNNGKHLSRSVNLKGSKTFEEIQASCANAPWSCTLFNTIYVQNQVEREYWKLTRYGGAETLRGCGACNLLGVSNPGLNGTKAGFCAGALWKPGLRFRWGVTTYASAGGIGISSSFLFPDSKPNASRAASCLFLSSASSRDSRLSNIGFSDLPWLNHLEYSTSPCCIDSTGCSL